MPRHFSAFLAVAVVSLVSVPCDASSRRPAADASWKEVIKRCADNQTLGKLVYFGPSNVVGPGSIWRKNGEGYNLRRLVSELGSADAVKPLIQIGIAASCTGISSSSFKIGLQASLENKIVPVTAGLGIDYKKAQEVKVTVDSWAWDQIVEGSFVDFVKAHPNNYTQDISQPARFFVGKALKIIGFTAELTFSREVAAELRAQYSGPVASLGQSDLAASLPISWKNDTTLVIKAGAEPFYVAGELWDYSDVGVAGPQDPIDKSVPFAGDGVGRDVIP